MWTVALKSIKQSRKWWARGEVRTSGIRLRASPKHFKKWKKQKAMLPGLCHRLGRQGFCSQSLKGSEHWHRHGGGGGVDRRACSKKQAGLALPVCSLDLGSCLGCGRLNSFTRLSPPQSTEQENKKDDLCRPFYASCSITLLRNSKPLMTQNVLFDW